MTFAAARMKHFTAQKRFLGYRKFPRQICISVNEEVVHGMAGPRRLEFGDIVSLDIGVTVTMVYRRHGQNGGGGRMRRARATVDGRDRTGSV
jgi:methionine aminopeptidase